MKQVIGLALVVLLAVGVNSQCTNCWGVSSGPCQNPSNKVCYGYLIPASSTCPPGTQKCGSTPATTAAPPATTTTTTVAPTTTTAAATTTTTTVAPTTATTTSAPVVTTTAAPRTCSACLTGTSGPCQNTQNKVCYPNEGGNCPAGTTLCGSSSPDTTTTAAPIPATTTSSAPTTAAPPTTTVAPVPTTTGAPTTKPSNPFQPEGKTIVVYYESWSSTYRWDPCTITDLPAIPSYVSVVNIAFIQPELSYVAGSHDLSNTGLQFWCSGTQNFDALKTAVASLRTKNPNVKVLLSVGGTTYNNWQAANFVAAAALVNDLDVDGIDFDYESESTGCTWASGGTSCSISDTQIANLITGYRNALGPNKLLTAYGWSTGAYAINGYPVYGNPTWCGLWVNPLRTVGTKIDAMWLGSYDAGPYFDTYDPRVAYDSYRALYAGAIGVGVQVAPEGWGGNVISLANVQTIANHVSSHGGQGIMIWSWQKQPSSGPNAKQIAQSLCTLYNLGNCGQRRGVLSFLKNIF